MTVRKFYLAIAIFGAVFLYGIGLAWYNSQTATPAYIADSVAQLDAAQRKRFAERIGIEKMTLNPKEMGKPLSRYDVQVAVDYATEVAARDEADARMVAAQDQAVSTALNASQAPTGGQPK